VQVEHVARISLAARRPAQQQRDLAIAHRVLRKVVVDQQRVTLRVAEVLAHRARCEWSEILHRRGLGRGRRDDDGVRHRAVLFQRLHNLRHRRPLLPDRTVDADQVLPRRVDDGVQRNRGLARLPVADQQLALSAADGDHGIDRLDARRHRFAYALALDHARRQPFHRKPLVGSNRSLVVDGRAQRVHHAPDQRLPHRHRHNRAGALYLIAFADLGVIAQQHGAHLGLVQVHRQAGNAVRKLEHLARHYLVQPMQARNAVAQRDHRSDLVDLHALLVVLNLLAEQLGYLIRVDLCHFVSCLNPLLNPVFAQKPPAAAAMRSPASA
jgi:hypothetical protein